ncbi:MAG: Rha family transcriptional regulator [Cetobacterium sp.]|uniref:Rha family transcriptional regulator n=1 Tax=Cetobacterium sp. TaxID=2071632 RepID=UPI003F3C4E51
MELVEIKKGEIYTDSLIYAKEFGITHRDLMEKIRNLTAEISAPENYWKLSKYTNKQGREYEKYSISKKGFMFLVMNTNAHKNKRKMLFEIQEKFVEAFFYMEKQLMLSRVNQTNIEWKKTREQGKNIRLELTDTIKIFVDYAFNQGSSNAKRYYSNITKMEYKALGLMEQKNPKLRDVLDTMELYQILMAEDLVKRQLKKYMENNLHYKEIYLLIKQDVENFAKGLLISQ